MTEPVSPPARRAATTTVFLLALTAFLGLLSSPVFPLGLVVGLGGVIDSVYLRRRYGATGGLLPLLPAIGGVAIAAALATPAVVSELTGGLAGVALVLWVADAPGRPEGTLRRATPSIVLLAFGVLFAWSITLFQLPSSDNFGLAVGLLVLALVLLAYLLAGFPIRRDEQGNPSS